MGQLLRYAFAFKNGRRVKNSVREEHISKTLEVLALGGSEEEPTSKSADSSKTKKKKDSILKRPFVLCSGGEQKRISIAQELMSLDGRFNLFLDEVRSFELCFEVRFLFLPYPLADHWPGQRHRLRPGGLPPSPGGHQRQHHHRLHSHAQRGNPPAL